jgi:hypothetical protein
MLPFFNRRKLYRLTSTDTPPTISQHELGGITIGQEINISHLGLIKGTSKAFIYINDRQVKELAKLLASMPGVIEPPKSNHRKRCKNGHPKPYWGRCEICDFLREHNVIILGPKPKNS